MKVNKLAQRRSRPGADAVKLRPSVTSRKPRLSFLRREPSQARGMESVIGILNACESLLGEKQADEIVVDEIAKRAHVLVGSVYFFFKDRLHIYLSLIEMTLRQIIDEYDAVKGQMDLPLAAFLQELDERMSRLWLQHRTMLDLFFAYKAHPDIKPIIKEMDDHADQVVASKIALEFPKMRPERRRSLAHVINMHLMLGLDAEAELSRALVREFRDDWRRMMAAYLAELRVQYK